MSPLSILDTTSTSLLLSAGISGIPFLIHFYSDPIPLDFTFILVTVISGAIALHLSHPTQSHSPQIRRLTFPLATTLSFLSSFFASARSLLSILPAPFLYYGIYSLPHTPTSSTLFSRLRYHPLLKRVLKKDDSRKIFMFLCLNLGFMVIQMGYGIYTNSLGLVSDSIHMLVDCAAIAFGLVASILADTDELDTIDTIIGGPHQCDHHHHEHDHHHDHHHSEKGDHSHEEVHPVHAHNRLHSHDHTHNHAHGHDEHHHHSRGRKQGKWAKLEDLAGFANAIFLVFVCLSILAEALGRLVWPEEVIEVEQLLVVSILGLAVNLVGVFSFNHGYPPPCFPLPTSQPSHPTCSVVNADDSHMGHNHGHDHHHHHNSNMHGIFLHVLADTLGSVGVIISTLLIRHFNWPGFDPLASILIAVLILASTVPLLKTTATALLLVNSPEQEYALRDVLGEVGVVPGVSSIDGVKVWDAGGTVRVSVKKDDLSVVRERVARVLSREGTEGVCIDVVRG